MIVGSIDVSVDNCGHCFYLVFYIFVSEKYERFFYYLQTNVKRPSLYTKKIYRFCILKKSINANFNSFNELEFLTIDVIVLTKYLLRVH